jgi:protein-disulfide isomerase
MGWIDRAKYAVLVVTMSGTGLGMWAQTPATPEPKVAPATSAEQVDAPVAPTPHVAVANPFPAVDPKNFTAESPTVAVVNDFLTQVWGANENRIWSVAGIEKTAAPGVSKIIVLLADKTKAGSMSQYAFYVTPDGKHAIADTLIDFGPKPFAERRKALEDGAAGPGEGAKGKELLVVEFGDLLNVKSKETHETAVRLLGEFPQARLVYETLPPEGRPYSMRAAVEGVCVRKAKGDAAFFTYAQEVYNKQDTLTPATVEAAFGAAATAAGADPTAVATCAATQAAKDEVKASMALAANVDVEQAPVLVVNGHILPQTVAYETLKTIAAFQAKQDGIVVHVQPTLSTLK